MRSFALVFLIFFVYGCKGRQKKTASSSPDIVIHTKATPSDTSAQPPIKFSFKQKVRFLDSVAKLNLQPLKDSLSFDEDSTFQRRKNLAISLSPADFTKLKSAGKEGKIDFKTAKRIFSGFNDSTFIIDGDSSVIIEHTTLSNNNDNFDEYAISIGGSDWSNLVYFFKKNQLIAFHDIFHRYGLEIKHFKDSDGRTVIYYKQNFGSGSGIWQFNYYFYKFLDNRLVPVLNMLENGNYTWPGPRTYWLETFVQSENPLKLKFVYYFFFKDSIGNDMLNDSTEVFYRYDQAKRTYIGNYKDSEINTDKILTYYLGDNELLFIKAYYHKLKAWIEGEDKTKRERTLNYLNEVMNYYLAMPLTGAL